MNFLGQKTDLGKGRTVFPSHILHPFPSSACSAWTPVRSTVNEGTSLQPLHQPWGPWLCSEQSKLPDPLFCSSVHLLRPWPNPTVEGDVLPDITALQQHPPPLCPLSGLQGRGTTTGGGPSNPASCPCLPGGPSSGGAHLMTAQLPAHLPAPPSLCCNLGEDELSRDAK